MGVNRSQTDRRQYVDECPAPRIVPEGKDDGGVFEHAERLEECGCVQATAGYHVAFDIPEHLRVCSFANARGEEDGVAGEKGFGK